MNKEHILKSVKPLVHKLLYFDRKEDEFLGIGDIRTAIKKGIVTTEEIVAEFSQRLNETILK